MTKPSPNVIFKSKYCLSLNSKVKSNSHKNPKEQLKDKYITLEECANIILRRKSNLWERSINQKDFLTLRLGIGNMPIDADIKYSKESFTMEEDEMKKKMLKFILNLMNL